MKQNILADWKLSGLLRFLKHNKPLNISIIITLLLTYGYKIIFPSIGIDAINYLSNHHGALEWELKIGRFSLVALQKLIPFNRNLAFPITIILFYFFIIQFCYLISLFSNKNEKNEKNNNLIFFALPLATSPVWIEQFYFLHQAIPVAILLACFPYLVYLFFQSLLNRSFLLKVTIISLLTFSFGLYQPFLVLFLCSFGLGIILLCSNDQEQLQNKLNWSFLIQGLLLIGLAGFATKLVDQLVLSLAHLNHHQYLAQMSFWGRRSIKENLVHLLGAIYLVFIGIPNLVPYLVHNNDQMTTVTNFSKLIGNFLLTPISLLFMIKIINFAKKLTKSKRWLIIMAALLIPLTTVLLQIAGGVTSAPIRTMMALPLATALMLFYLLQKSQNKLGSKILIFMSFFTAFHQASVTVRLQVSDQKRYEFDQRMAHNLNQLITKASNLPIRLKNSLKNNQELTRNGHFQLLNQFSKQKPHFVYYKKIPLAIIVQSTDDPKRYFAGLYQKLLIGEVIGHSCFYYQQSPDYVQSFLVNSGFNFTLVNPQQLAEIKADQVVKKMPVYPNPNCVQKFKDLLVVKL